MKKMDTTLAIEAAARAFTVWRGLLPQERRRYLRAWHDAIVAAREDLAQLMTAEQGKSLDESRSEIDYAASFVSWYADEAVRVAAESVESHLPGAETIIWQEPLGVAALVTPWNFPSAMITRKASAALAAGCTAVIVPSMEAPFSALALAEFADRSGIPQGVFNVVTGTPSPIVSILCQDSRVRAVSFTGSTEIGLADCGAMRSDHEASGHGAWWPRAFHGLCRC